LVGPQGGGDAGRLAQASTAVRLIMERGFNRGRDLVSLFAGLAAT